MTHRYFFWIDGEEVEIYKNGLLYKFDGEKRCNFKNNIERFWKKWEENSAFIPECSDVDFVFLGRDKSAIDELRNYPENNYKWSKNGEFTFADLKAVLQDKKVKKFCVDTGDNKFFFKKNSYEYTKIPKDSKLEIIYLVGNCLKTDFILKEDSDIEEEVSMVKSNIGEKSAFVKLFENKMKEYKA